MNKPLEIQPDAVGVENIKCRLRDDLVDSLRNVVDATPTNRQRPPTTTELQLQINKIISHLERLNQKLS